MSESPLTHPRPVPRGLSTARRGLLFAIPALALVLIGTFAQAAAPKMCIPDIAGVPGSSGAPDWWTPGQTTQVANNPNPLAYQPFDPRWRGAMNLDYGSGSISQVDYRGLYQDGAQKRLLLSWRVKSTAQFGIDHTALYVGFYSPTADRGALLKVRLKDTATGQDPRFPAGTPLPRKVGELTAGGTPYFEATLTTGDGTNPATWTAPATMPAWLTETLRVWINAQINPYNWTVQLRVPLAATIANGLDLPTTGFRMWSYTQVEALLSAATPPGVVPYTWPRPDPGSVLAYASYQSGLSQVFPAADTWGEFALSANPAADPTCSGVYLANDRIGTRAALGSSRISLNGANTFFAEPQNKTDTVIASGILSATFKLANWGSQVGDSSAASWSAPAALTNVNTGPGGGGGTGAAANGGFATIEGTWNPSTNLVQDVCPFIGKNGVPATPWQPGIAGNPACPNANPTRMLHQCMLVDLQGPGLNFVRGSAARNMDFVDASRFEREAEISVVGLPGLAAGQREVFLYAERRNMPRTVPVGDTGGSTDGNPEQPGLRDRPQFAALATTGTTAPTNPASDEELADAMPTWITHSYHDSGETIRLEGQDYRVLAPQTSFGYFVSHQGPLQGWSDLIEGADRLREDLYRVAPPNNGSVRVTTVVQAVEPGETPVGQPWPPAEQPIDFLRRWWWLILILVLVVLVMVWRRSGP